MDINWQILRPLNGSLNDAFEELCCQLAASEPSYHLSTAVPIQSGSRFTRKGTPDAGVECFWKQPNGSEIAWQAKFFLDTLGDSQWAQLDDSVNVALKKHPQLQTYIICIPQDRADPRIDNQKWFMNKWTEWTHKWEQLARRRKMKVEFHYWGASEIITRLAQDEHRGRRFFWFDKESLSPSWFHEHVEETVAQVGPRYTPELTVKVPISSLFSSLSITKEFVLEIISLVGEVANAVRECQKTPPSFADAGKVKTLEQMVLKELEPINGISRVPILPIDWLTICESLRGCESLIHEIDASLEEAIKAARKATCPKDGNKDADRMSWYKHYLWQLLEKIDRLRNFCKSSRALLLNRPALLIVGDAGSGKTHLLCDVAKQRVNANLPAILLIGGRFNKEEPWNQIIRQLGLACATKEEFLGAIDAAGQAAGVRTLILIDALNESYDRYVWKQYLASMLATLSRYPWVALAVTVRSSYEAVVLDEDLIKNSLIREEHTGFEGCVYDAVSAFFSYFNIELPSAPILVPEFYNPLFLRLFCKAINNAGLKRMPEGLYGFSEVFDFFVKETNKKLARSEFLDFDSRVNVVAEAIDKLAESLARTGSNWILRDEARNIIDGCLPRSGYENTLFAHLLSEGVIAEDLRYSNPGQYIEVVHFGFERFSDHYIVKHILAQYPDISSLSVAVESKSPLASILADESSCYEYRGLIEALAVQIPERYQQELPSIKQSICSFSPVRMAFVEALLWRKASSINENTLQYINEEVLRDEDSNEKFWHVVIRLACRPKHPLNADWLHRYLIDFEMPNRDQWWSIWLYIWYENSQRYERKNAIDQLLDWSLSRESQLRADPEAVLLAAKAIGWFFTTSNRFLRDRATKALVQLLTDRLGLAQRLATEFEDVNDLYVQERLIASIYGAVLRSGNKERLKELAEYIYNRFFVAGTPVPHILLRDYARGIIEYALYQKLTLNVEPNKIRPPYHSEWPKAIIPLKKLKSKYSGWRNDFSNEEKSLSRLYENICGFSDFARYIIGTNSGFSIWSTCRIGVPRKKTPKERVRAFVESLSPIQAKALDKLRETEINTLRCSLPHIVDDNRKLSITVNQAKGSKKTLEQAVTRFMRLLEDSKHKEYKALVRKSGSPGLRYCNSGKKVFDLSLVQSYVFTRILELGWTHQRFGNFDYNRRQYDLVGRGTRKGERIGKKYAWIALHECLSRISDNFELMEEDHSTAQIYEGPWQEYMRDIDPTWITPATKKQKWWDSHQKAWWFPCEYSQWRDEPNDHTWLSNKDWFPFDKLLKVTDSDGHHWLCLNAFYSLKEPVPAHQDSDYPKREMWCMIKGYLIKKEDSDIFYRWAQKKNFWGNWMPEGIEQIHIFLGEFFWSPAFTSVDIPYYGHEGWTDTGRLSRLPCKVLVTWENYLHESQTYDCSIIDTVAVTMPAAAIVRGMGLREPCVDGRWLNKSGSVVAQDPSVCEYGPGTILIKADEFRKFLDKAGYELVWIILGEKRALNGFTNQKSLDRYSVVNGVYRWLKDRFVGNVRIRLKTR